MIDEIGGLDAALDAAAARAGLKTGQYKVQTIPGPRSFAEMLMGDRDETRSPVQTASPQMLQLLPEALRAPLLRQLALMNICQHQPIMLITPFVVAE